MKSEKNAPVSNHRPMSIDNYLPEDFFARDTLTVARELVGTTIRLGSCEGRIVETEAYTTDAASHSVTRPVQARAMRETFGHVYVYFIYGMYYCLNFTTDREGPGAVLIRAVEPTEGIEEMIRRRGTKDIRKLASGPGRLCQAFGIDLSFNGARIGDRIKVGAREATIVIAASPRVGISSATELEWRFYEEGNRFVSRQKILQT
jgi:DNA-3-methyladenine glycosylase